METLRSAAELEDALGGSPQVLVISAHQLYAQELLSHQQPKLALLEFQKVLNNSPNRFNALYGAASAAEALRAATTATGYYRQLTEIARGDERPELVVARQKLTSSGTKISSR